MLVCGVNALTATRRRSESRSAKETWVYDVRADAWRPIAEELDLPRYTWLTLAKEVR